MERGKGALDNLGTGVKNDLAGNKLKQNVVFDPVVSCYSRSFEQPTSGRLKNTTGGEPEGYVDNDLGANRQHDGVLEYGPWLIRNAPFILRKWNPSFKWSKEELTSVLKCIKFHSVIASTFTIDGLTVIATRFGTPVMLDSCTVTTCIKSWGRMDYARALVDIRVDLALKDTMVILVPNPVDNGVTVYTIKEFEKAGRKGVRALNVNKHGMGGTKKKVGASSKTTGTWLGRKGEYYSESRFTSPNVFDLLTKDDGNSMLRGLQESDNDPDEEDVSDETAHSSKSLGNLTGGNT
nr:hypothetical protein [Tanacetum cinerariifolium]